MSSSDDEDAPKQVEQKKPEEPLPALFWDTMPENAEDNPDFAAMEALRAESTPEERAETFKVGAQVGCSGEHMLGASPLWPAACLCPPLVGLLHKAQLNNDSSRQTREHGAAQNMLAWPHAF